MIVQNPIQHEYKEMDKNPLHLLLENERHIFPQEIEDKVNKLWATTSNPDRDEKKFVVKKVFKIKGREVYFMQEVYFRHIYAMLANYSNIEKGLKPVIPGLHLTLANPIGKFQTLSFDQWGVQTNSILGQDRERDQLTAIGGHLDKEDFMECTLPNGMKPIAPFRSDGKLDIKSIVEMCQAMDEAEQQLVKFDCPAIRCVLREGKEEGGIDCYTLKPIGKCEKIYITPFGEKRIIENWPVYNLIPEKETTYEELMQTFHAHDRTLKQLKVEREFSNLHLLENRLLGYLLRSKFFTSLPQRPSVEPALRVEHDHQNRETLSPLFDRDSISINPLLFKQVQEILQTAKEPTPRSTIRVKDVRSRI